MGESALRLRRLYDAPSAEEGRLVLVDRLWPRGVSRSKLGDMVWMRELGPSDELRRWFGHRPERWPEFRRRYREELARPELQPPLQQLLEMARKGPVTLLFGASDRERNQAVVLREVLEERLRAPAG